MKKGFQQLTGVFPKPYRMAPALLIYLIIMVLGMSGCSGDSQPASSITVAGSTSVQPFMDLLAEEYARLYPDKPAVNVQGGGSSAGVRSVLTGAASVGMLSRRLTSDEAAENLNVIVMAQDAIAVIVNPQNPITDISLEDLCKIYTGEITDWGQLSQVTQGTQVSTADSPGNQDSQATQEPAGQGSSEAEEPDNAEAPFQGRIHVISREEGSGTRGAFDELVMGGQEVTPRSIFQDSNGAIRQTVAQDPMAIGYISLGLVDDSVKPLAISGGAPTVENCRSGKYMLVRPFILVFQHDVGPEVRDYLDFVTGSHSREILSGEGLITDGEEAAR